MTRAVLILTFFAASTLGAWRQATEAELKQVIPARAPVQNERIETELRTASGITDGEGHFIAGVVLITAGYSADGKYSHFLTVQKRMRVGEVKLPPGNYVFGWTKGENTLHIKLYEAQTGTFLGNAEATRTSRTGPIEQFHMNPPGDNALLQIGRFAVPYRLEGLAK